MKALLPETGTDIKGQMRSRQELLEASGYANRPRDFDDLIHILDPELRLITPTDPEGVAGDERRMAEEKRFSSFSPHAPPTTRHPLVLPPPATHHPPPATTSSRTTIWFTPCETG